MPHQSDTLCLLWAPALQENEPDIFNAIKFGTILENVVFDEVSPAGEQPPCRRARAALLGLECATWHGARRVPGMLEVLGGSR